MPNHNGLSQRAMAHTNAQSGIVSTFFVTEQVKSKMTSECDPRQVNFVHKGFESAANLHEADSE